MRYFIATLLLLFLPFTASAAIARDAHKADATTCSGVTTCSISFTAASGAMIEVWILGNEGTNHDDNVTSVNWNTSEALTRATSTPITYQQMREYVYYITTPTSGTHNVTINTAATDFLEVGIVSYTGFGSVGNAGMVVSNGVSASSASISVSVSGTGCWLSSFFTARTGGTAAGSGTTLLDNTAGTNDGLFDSNGAVSSGTPSLNFTFTAFTGWGGQALAICPPAAAVSGPGYSLMWF